MKTDNPRRRQATRRAHAVIFGGALFGALTFFAIGLRVGQIATLRNMEQPEVEPPAAVEEVVSVAMKAPEAVKAQPLVCIETLPEMAEALAIEEAPEPIEEPASYTDAELEMLALAIYQEAGGDTCSDDTRLKVGTVVMNRVADSRFPDSIYEVLTQERQYGRLYWTGLIWPERADLPEEAHAVERAYDCAERILEGERFLPGDVIFQSEYLMGEIVAEQDGFYFCR